MDFHPQNLLICFDTPKPTFRNVLSKEYQAQRPKIGDDFISQIPLVQTLLDRAGFVRAELDGFEADDVIGTMAAKYKKNHKVLILTGDKDIFQLVDKNVIVISPKFGFSETILYDHDAVLKKMGIPPALIPDYKALVGDSSDNYKGAKGIGPKTAISLLLKFGSVENVLKNSKKIENERVRNLIESNIDEIHLSHQLAKINISVPIGINFEKTKFTGFNVALEEFLKSLEIKSLRLRIFGPKKEEIGKSKKVKRAILPTDQIELF